MVPWLALIFLDQKESIQFYAKTDMNLSSLPRCFTIAMVKSGGFLMSARVLRLWPPKCHGPIVEVGSHIIIIVIIVIVIIVIIKIITSLLKSIR